MAGGQRPAALKEDAFCLYLPCIRCRRTAPACGTASPTAIFRTHRSPCPASFTARSADGFAAPIAEKIGCRFESDTIVEVTGGSADAASLREMLAGGRLIKLGCGFNPKAPRHAIYPAGSNAPGALHFGIDLTKPSDYVLRTVPQGGRAAGAHGSGHTGEQGDSGRPVAD